VSVFLLNIGTGSDFILMSVTRLVLYSIKSIQSVLYYYLWILAHHRVFEL